MSEPRCPEGCGVALVEETRDVADWGYQAADPDAPSHDEQWMRCPSCGYECEAEAMLKPFVPEHGRPAPTEDEVAERWGLVEVGL